MSNIENGELWFPLQAVDDVWKSNEPYNDLKEIWENFVNDHPFQDHYQISNKQIYVIREHYKDSKFIVVPELINKYEAIKLIAAIKNEKYDIEDIQNRLIEKAALVLKDKSDVMDMFVLSEYEVKEKFINEYNWPPTTYSKKIWELEMDLGIQNTENCEYFKTINQKVYYSGLWLLKVDEYYGNEKPVYSQGKFKEVVESESGTSYSKSEFEDLLKRTKVRSNVIYSRDIEGKGRFYSGYALEKVLDFILKDGVHYEYVKKDYNEEQLNEFKYTINDVKRIVMEECYVTQDEFSDITHKLSDKYRTYRTGTSEYHERIEVWDEDERYVSDNVHFNERWLEIIRKYISDTKMIYTLDKLREEVGNKKRSYSKLEFEQIVRKSRVRKESIVIKKKKSYFLRKLCKLFWIILATLQRKVELHSKRIKYNFADKPSLLSDSIETGSSSTLLRKTTYS